ncbi:MAG: NAD(P)/FAD-dependent oxidoreductase [Halioglobus sp.]|nr:NAD(P)/FAD-dependent oxidoreductase [Halioglobus sp.]
MVIVGAGPVGVRALRELRRELPNTPIVLFGEERYHPYNRVQLSGLLAGQHKVQDIALEADLLEVDCPYTTFHSARISAVDTLAKVVIDTEGNRQAYSKLIIATGSRPFIPGFVARDVQGVYTFRDMADAEKLAARRVQSKHTVVLGAGLLGIEAARAMQRHHTKVTLVDHNPHPMFRQLDPAAGGILAQQLLDAGIELQLGTSIRMVMGTNKVEGIVLHDGSHLDCDTLVVATGIRPNRDLAEQAGLAYGRGITVNDQMQTSLRDIYAIGECCELAGEVFGLVAPGFEQAGIVARNIANAHNNESYQRNIFATSLKVAGLSVFSMGDADPPSSMRTFTWHEGNTYRRLTLSAGHLVSINAIGDWSELPALRNLANKRKWIAPWRLWQFQRSGLLFADDSSADVVAWPAAAVVCNCNAVSKGEIQSAIGAGANNLAAVTCRTHAGAGCGSCKPLLQELIGGNATREPVKGAATLRSLSIPLLVIALLGMVFSFDYPSSVQVEWDWGDLWRVELNKQISGFTILGLCVASLVFSLRKRIGRIQLGDFDWWRIAHIATTALAFMALGLHTGFRMGSQLNFALSLTFVALLVAGTVLAIGIACEHRLAPARARRLRSLGLWSHVMLSWPLPALLGAHILKTYYF